MLFIQISYRLALNIPKAIDKKSQIQFFPLIFINHVIY